MRHKRSFIFIGILILSALCIYAVVHTVPATATVLQKEGSDAVRATVKTKECSCCDRVSRIKLEMARDKNVPTEHLDLLEEEVLVWEEIE